MVLVITENVIEMKRLFYFKNCKIYIKRIIVFFQINLRLILVSGKTKEFLFSPNDSASDIAKHVYDNWPMGEWYFSLGNE